jgi:hypothetical protein
MINHFDLNNKPLSVPSAPQIQPFDQLSRQPSFPGSAGGAKTLGAKHSSKDSKQGKKAANLQNEVNMYKKDSVTPVD